MYIKIINREGRDVFEWDEVKAAENLAKHGVDFEQVEAFELDEAVIRKDGRAAYGETRLVALGPLNGRLHVLVFTLRGEKIRVISLRKANSRERSHYDEA